LFFFCFFFFTFNFQIRKYKDFKNVQILEMFELENVQT
jgi:hypothetical protein